MKNVKLAITSLLIPIAIIGILLALINLKLGYQPGFFFLFFQKPIQIFMPLLLWNYIGFSLFTKPKFVGLIQWFALGIWLFFGPFIVLLIRQFSDNDFIVNPDIFNHLFIYTSLISTLIFFTFPIFQFKFLTIKKN